MKLNDIRPHIESSEDLEEKLFSIGDASIVFDILRSKLYSNPILAVCREISCNARDAHREIGKPNEPIIIQLPTNLEPDYKIKDFGPGISPDRIENIYIKYGTSSKRNDNIQTGGFGLGGKSIFSISDLFTINTIYNKVRYSYTCYIDETKVGKLALLSKEETDKPNETEICIPVKNQDFNLFKQYTEQACRHWDVKPIIKGGSIEWKASKKIIEGNNWCIVNNNGVYYDHEAKIIIDGIEYPLKIEALRKYANSDLINSIKGNLWLYFSIGELSLSANREQIYLDKPTQEKIKQCLEDVKKELKKNIQTKIDNFSNLWEANIYYRRELGNLFNNLKLFDISWKSCILNNQTIYIGCTGFAFTKGKYHKYGVDPNKLTRSTIQSLSFVEDSELYINDLPIKNITVKHIKKIFDQNSKLKSIQIICFTDFVNEDKLNKTINLEHMQPKRLSSLIKTSARAKYTSSLTKLIVFKFDSINDFSQVSIDSIKEDHNEKILCLLTKGKYDINRSVLLSNGKSMSASDLRILLKQFPKKSYYGINSDTDPIRIKKEFSKFQSIEDFVNEKFLSDKTIDFVKLKFAADNYDSLDEKLLKFLPKFKSLINSKSEFLTRLNLHYEIKNLYTSNVELLNFYQLFKKEISELEIDDFLIKNPQYDIVKTNENYEKKYPLLNLISQYYTEKAIEYFANYINMIDEKENVNV